MSIEECLSAGNRRSLGKTEYIVDLVLHDQDQLPELFDCLFSDDEIVRMRASDALEKVCRQRPQWLETYKDRLLFEVSQIRQPSVQWHLAQMLTEVSLTRAEQQQATHLLQHNLGIMDDWIVVNLTLEALAEFTRRGDFDRKKMVQLLEKKKLNKHKSVVARCHKLLKEFS